MFVAFWLSSVINMFMEKKVEKSINNVLQFYNFFHVVI